MKKFYLTIIIMSTIFIGSGAEVPNGERLSSGARITKVAAGKQPFLWVTRGQLYWVTFGQGTEGCYIYRSPAGRPSIITGETAALSSMVNEEIEGSDKTKDFVRSNFAAVAFSLFGRTCDFVIDEQYIQMREKLLPSEWRVDADEHKKQSSQQILKKYISPQSLVLSTDAWNWTVYVTGENGSIEKWVFAGALHPFKISAMEKIRVENEGTIVPVAQSTVTLDPKIYN